MRLVIAAILMAILASCSSTSKVDVGDDYASLKELIKENREQKEERYYQHKRSL